MKLVALTYGTEGDTRPIAAVCRALMDAGHDVTLLADAFWSPCRCAFGRSAFRSRSVLLGRAVTPERHSASRGERPESYGRQFVSCGRCRPNGRDAGAGAVGATMRAEDGLAKAVDRVHALLAHEHGRDKESPGVYPGLFAGVKNRRGA